MSINTPNKIVPAGAIRVAAIISKEVIIPIAMALIVIQFVIQAFKIPTGSMENSLLEGDFLLGLKFIYGSPVPFTHKKLPALAQPQPGDVLIFKYPGDPEYPDYNPSRYKFLANLFLFGNLYWDKQPQPGQNHLVWYAPKDFIKRCVAKSGQTVKVRRKTLSLDGKKVPLPPKGKYMSGMAFSPIRDSLDFLLPTPGTQYKMDTLTLTQAAWIRSLALQENPDKKVGLHIDLYINDTLSNQEVFSEVLLPYTMDNRNIFYFLGKKGWISNRGNKVYYQTRDISFKEIQTVAKTGFMDLENMLQPLSHQKGTKRVMSYEYFFGKYLEELLSHIQLYYEGMGQHIAFVPSLVIDGKKQTEYTTRYNCYLMMGDNRDNSSDGRYWGLLSEQNVKAKAFITYLSLENSDNTLKFSNPFSWLLLPFKIRWSRIGKLIE